MCVSEETIDVAPTGISAKMPRQSSRLAEKFERHAKRKLDSGDEESMVYGKLKGRRKSADPDIFPKRRNILSPKLKDQKAAISSPPVADISENCSKIDSSQQSDKYCHFCQVLNIC